MNRHIVTDDGWITDRWHAEGRTSDVCPDAARRRDPDYNAATAHQWNRDDLQAAARRRGVKP